MAEEEKEKKQQTPTRINTRKRDHCIRWYCIVGKKKKKKKEKEETTDEEKNNNNQKPVDDYHTTRSPSCLPQ